MCEGIGSGWSKLVNWNKCRCNSDSGHLRELLTGSLHSGKECDLGLPAFFGGGSNHTPTPTSDLTQTKREWVTTRSLKNKFVFFSEDTHSRNQILTILPSRICTFYHCLRLGPSSFYLTLNVAAIFSLLFSPSFFLLEHSLLLLNLFPFKSNKKLFPYWSISAVISWLPIAHNIKPISKPSVIIHSQSDPSLPLLLHLLTTHPNHLVFQPNWTHSSLESLVSLLGFFGSALPSMRNVVFAGPAFLSSSIGCTHCDITSVQGLVKAELLVSSLYLPCYVAVNCLHVCFSLWAIIRLRVTTLLISCRMSLTSIFSPEYTTDFHNHVSSCFWTSPECPTISLKSLCPIPNTLILSQKCSFCSICFSYHHYLLSHFPGWEPKTQLSPLPSCHISH